MKEKDTPRVAYLKKAIKQGEKLMKTKNLQGNRPYVAVEMMLGVYRAELALALKKEKPMYETQQYSQLTN